MFSKNKPFSLEQLQVHLQSSDDGFSGSGPGHISPYQQAGRFSFNSVGFWIETGKESQGPPYSGLFSPVKFLVQEVTEDGATSLTVHLAFRKILEVFGT